MAKPKNNFTLDRLKYDNPTEKFRLLYAAVKIALQRLEEIQYQKASHEHVAFLKEVLSIVRGNSK